MPAHMSSAQSLQMQQQQQQQQHSVVAHQQQKSSSRDRDQTSFSAVLRNLAKQQDIKDDDMGQSTQQQQHQQNESKVRGNEKEIDMSRQGNSSRSLPYDSRGGHTTIRHMPSPEPPEKKVNFEFLSFLKLN